MTWIHPPSADSWSFRKRLALVFAAATIYVLLFLLLYRYLGPELSAMALLPVIVAGWIGGMLAGLLAGLLAILLNALLFGVVGASFRETLLFVTGPGSLSLIFIGAIVGMLSDLQRRLREQSRELALEVAERKRVEEALRQQQLLVRRVIDTIPDLIFVKNRDGEYILANEAFARRHELTPEEIQGKLDTDFYSIEEAEQFLREDRKVMDALQERFTPELRVVGSNGNARWLQVVKKPLVLDDGRADQVLAIATDITERKQIEQTLREAKEAAETSSTAKSDFVSLVSHELKTPITAVNLAAELLALGARGPVNDAQHKLLQTIRSNTDRLSKLVSDLSDISRIEGGRLLLEFNRVCLNGVVEEALESIRGQISEKGQTLAVKIPDELPPVLGDRNRLIQVFTNLLSNAHKYTPTNGRITVSAERVTNQWDSEGAPEVIHVTVQDTGIGISPQDQKQLFQKFFRSADEKARVMPGTGLGLSITKNLVEKQGGRIWLESELRQGATFHFTVPVAQERPQPVAETAVAEQTPSSQGSVHQ